MRRFESRQVREAVAWAMEGGLAIHLHRFVTERAPPCFRRAVERGEEIAHLFGQDEELLVSTARRLGVRAVRVEKRGTAQQHIDLCGKPLQLALEEAAREE